MSLNDWLPPKAPEKPKAEKPDRTVYVPIYVPVPVPSRPLGDHLPGVVLKGAA
jgi:hypothetical protein